MVKNYVHLDDCTAFLNYFSPWNNVLEGYVFRGHSSEKFELKPTAMRDGFLEKYPPLYSRSNEAFRHHPRMIQIRKIISEFILLRDFYMMADRQGLHLPNSEYLRDSLNYETPYELLSRFSSEEATHWIPKHLEEVAALAQHYKIPTRLLDWTYDPYVALYFACKGAINKEGRLAIWCFNKKETALHFGLNGRLKIRFITPPYSGNPNLNAQKGLFTHIPITIKRIHIDTPLEKTEYQALDELIEGSLDIQNAPKEVFRIVTLPCSQAAKTCDLLEKNNYGIDRIFPGYQGIADRINQRYPPKDFNQYFSINSVNS